MKKTIGLLALSGILMIIGVLAFHGFHISHQKRLAKIHASDLPQFSFQQKNGSIFTRDSLTKNKATLIMRLSPSCGGCWSQLNELKQVSEEVSPLQLLIVAPEEWDELQRIQQWIKANTSWEVTVVRDSFDHFQAFFGTRSLPALLCYTPRWALYKSFTGETKAAILKPHLLQMSLPASLPSQPLSYEHTKAR